MMPSIPAIHSRTLLHYVIENCLVRILVPFFSLYWRLAYAFQKRKALTFCKIIEKGGNHVESADDRWESSSKRTSESKDFAEKGGV
ncbi:hypothetical protein AMR95_03800 [Bacillus sp. G1(2015b)]|nr:hypothetical protein AMR95_03800 [Bacillus sp. G1(2015b)]